MTKLKPGFNENISNEEYHSEREHVSSSALKLMLKNPKEFYSKYVLNEQTSSSSAAMDLGSYIHARILEPHLVEKEFAIWENGYRRGKAWEDFQKQHDNKIIITSSQKYLTDEIVKSFEEEKVVLGKPGNEKEVLLSSFYTNGMAEETLCGEIDGIKIKVRFDYRKEFDSFASINDIKTTGEPLKYASLDALRAICDAWSYPLSAALYVDMAEQQTGKPHDFYFTFLSKADKGIQMVKASEDFLEKGRKEYKEAIKLLKEARKSGIYYINKIKEI